MKVILIMMILNDSYRIGVSSTQTPSLRGHCGADRSGIRVVYEGEARLHTYPWLGVLYYPTKVKRYTTSVVLVTTQMVIASAVDIDRIPKTNFRALSRVVLGGNCSGTGVKVKDYTYHPDYKRSTYSAPALVQLENIPYLQPICPPRALGQPLFYVMTIDDCKRSRVKIHKMSYVDPAQCKNYYRVSELDNEKLLPSHTLCAKASTGRECVWQNGAVLAMRQNSIWSLVGFGIHGPGCRAPARFLEYSKFRPWIRNSIARIGRPTVSRIDKNHLVLRRSFSNVQRYGLCDPEETKSELFTDYTEIERGPTYKKQRVRYNMLAIITATDGFTCYPRHGGKIKDISDPSWSPITNLSQCSLTDVIARCTPTPLGLIHYLLFTIFSNLEYSCVTFRVYHYKRPRWLKDKPYIRLKRWCQAPRPICYSFQLLQIDFSVEIYFRESVKYQVMAYGREVRLIDMRKVMVRVNDRKPYPKVVMGSGLTTQEPFKKQTDYE